MRGPLYIMIPLVAIICTAIIGVSIGLLNLQIREATDSTIGPVVFAAGLTFLIMGVATYLSYRSPESEE